MAEDFAPRRADKNQRFQTVDGDGKQITMRADAAGIVRPTSVEQEALADVFGLPRAHDVPAKAKATTKAKKSAKPAPAAPASIAPAQDAADAAYKED